MDAARKRQLKAIGKAEVARQSEAIHASLAEANSAAIGSDAWAKNHRTGTLREKWLRKRLPILHKDQLHKLFVVHPYEVNRWSPFIGGYIMCTHCGSAAPSALPRRLFYWGSCVCGNIRWNCLLAWRKGTITDASAIVPIKLIGRG